MADDPQGNDPNDGFVGMVVDTILLAWAYVSGDQERAERLQLPVIPEESWITESKKSEELSRYAMESALRSSQGAQEAVGGVQEKAAGLVSLTVTLFALALAASGLSAGGIADHPVPAFVALALFVAVDALLLQALVRAFFASGSLLSGGLKVRLTDDEAKDVTIPVLQAREADAWLVASEIAKDAARGRSLDLFFSRRCLILALCLSLVATIPLAISREGSQNKPASVPSPSSALISSP